MKSKLTVAAFLVLGLMICAAGTGCPAKEPPAQQGQTRTGGTQDVATSTDLSGVTIEGAGASFPFPIYSQWAFRFEELTGLKLNYQSVGSGAGISAIREKTVDFGASDSPLEAAELDQYGLVQFPMVIGGVVPVINVPGIQPGQLKLTSDAIAKIYLGEIPKWNDPAIAQINPGIALPDLPISVVNRADGSGTTWIFTSYLAAVSPKWADKVGVGKSVEWPTGSGGRGNEGVASMVAQINGTIGFVEYAYALQNNMVYAMLQNRDGNFVNPTVDTFSAAASYADWANAPGYYMVLVDQPGADSWPIVGASFILLYKQQTDPDKARAMLEYFDWCFKHGQQDAIKLDYVPIPENVVAMIEATWSDEITVNGVKVWQ